MIYKLNDAGHLFLIDFYYCIQWEIELQRHKNVSNYVMLLLYEKLYM